MLFWDSLKNVGEASLILYHVFEIFNKTFWTQFFYIRNVLWKSESRGVFRNLSNIYDEAFCKKAKSLKAFVGQ